ncbi:5'/3'-nucleotidase SurE [Oleispirillum naphthae]|uniref:5'/3'-nucleotidase SurE n=1 Tax=Oleispirillum naphthae TaxID=2838853 RepID=UPI003082360E
MNAAPMFALPPLAGARVLITNDDGIHAPGLKVLESVALALGMEAWVVAPETEQSGAGHSLTLHRPLRWRQAGERRFGVEGTPTDCVLLAINKFMAEAKPDLLLSGVNRGANMGDDVTYSGTIAAAMEGTLLGVPSIAVSQVFTPQEPVKWRTAEVHAPEIIRRLCARGWPAEVLMSVNFPDVPAAAVKGVALAPQGHHKVGDNLVERIDPRGRPYIWIGSLHAGSPLAEGTDMERNGAGWATVTPLSVNLTHRATLDHLAGAFDAVRAS